MELGKQIWRKKFKSDRVKCEFEELEKVMERKIRENNILGIFGSAWAVLSWFYLIDSNKYITHFFLNNLYS